MNEDGTSEALFSPNVLNQHCPNASKSVYACHFDYEIAFFKVRRDRFREFFKENRVDIQKIRIIENLYYNQTAHIKMKLT